MSQTFMKNIISNVIEYITFRKLKLSQFSIAKALDELNSLEYCIINCEDVVVVVTKKDGKYSGIEAKTKDLLNRLWKPQYSEMIYICGIDYSYEPGMAKLSNILANILESNIKVRSYKNFLFNMSINKMIPKHEIADPAEVEALFKFMRLTGKELPRIHEYDTAAVWIGAKPGDIVKVIRLTPSTLASPVYLRVV